jgi:hypothetical protein
MLLFLPSDRDWGILPSDRRGSEGGGDVDVGSVLDAAFSRDCALAWRVCLGASAKMGFLPAYQHRSPRES